MARKRAPERRTVEKRPAAKRSAAPRAEVRRVPVQARSRERHGRILDAAAAEFAEHGVEAATIEAIAARAGTSVASVYQFFPNKLALFEALIAKYFGGARAIFDEIFAAGTSHESPSWEDLLDRTVDAFAAFDRSGPAFRAIWTNIPHAAHVLGDAHTVNREFAKRVETLLRRHARGVSPGRRALVATMIVEVMAAALTFAASSRNDRLSDAVVAETKVLLRRYLEPYTRR